MKRIPAAASSARPGLPSGMSAVALTEGASPPFGLPGMPSGTFLPSISMVSPDSLACVSRVSIHPNAWWDGEDEGEGGGEVRRELPVSAARLCQILTTVFARTPNAPHSLAMVLVMPTTADFAAE